ncbi:MAG: hypothetical protein WCU88_06030 [Elusimicrobiota bacterium]|jgi:hypothetical protein
MNAIVTDVWALVCIVGLLAGTMTFIFLLKKRRAAACGGSLSEEEILSGRSQRDGEPQPVRVLPAQDAVAPKKIVSSALQGPASSAAPAAEAPSSAGSTKTDIKITTGSLSPAVVYLQNLKMQMEHFENEIQHLQGDLTGFVHRHDSQFDALLSRLGELQTELHQQMSEYSGARSAAQETAPVVILPPERKEVPAPASVPAAAKPAPVQRAAPASAKAAPPAPAKAAPVPAAVKPAAVVAPEIVAVVEQAPAPVPAKAAAVESAKPVHAEKKRADPVRIPMPSSSAPAQAAKVQDKGSSAEETQPAAEKMIVIEAKPAETPVQSGPQTPVPAKASTEAEETLVLKPEAAAEIRPKRGPVWPV